MERRFKTRLKELEHGAEVSPSIFRGMLPRLERFVRPFADCLPQPEQKAHAHEYVAGLLSNLQRQTVEAIAYLHDQDRQALQKFIGQAPWDHRPLLTELARQVGAELGQADAVLVFDPSAFPKKGTASVGVQRQWCGRLGKVDNCQVGLYLGYVSRLEHALVDVRLYLPQGWAKDQQRRRRAGVPREVRFRTRHELALEMLREKGPLLPHAWVAGDDEMGRCSRFRQQLRELGERYLLAVPSNTLIRDLAAQPPASAGCGRRPQAPFARVDRWCAALPQSAWSAVEVRDGEKGPLVVQAVTARVQAKTERRRAGPEEVLFVTRVPQGDGTYKHDYYLGNASAATPLRELARVAKAEHRIEECLQRAKGQAGLASYEVRTWKGWHHHQALSLMATWFLVQEARRGKKVDAGDYGGADPPGRGLAIATGVGLRSAGTHQPECDAAAEADRAGAAVLLEEAEPLAAAQG